MSRGRWNSKRNEPQVMAIVRTPDGKLVKKPLQRDNNNCKLYDGYVKSLSGLYVPKVLQDWQMEIRKRQLQKAVDHVQKNGAVGRISNGQVGSNG